MTLANGTVLSVQTGAFMYCHPRKNLEQHRGYKSMEVMVIEGEIPKPLESFYDGQICPYTPTYKIIQAIRDCGGIQQ